VSVAPFNARIKVMRTLLVAAMLLLIAAVAGADTLTVHLPNVSARRAIGAINVDGLLNEPDWTTDPMGATFVQAEPDEAAQPSFATIAQVLYDDNAIYIGARMHDAYPDSIVHRLCRRDDGARSDEFTVYLDPYYDRRSGYWFVISAAGTLRDGILYNDSWDDSSWDGVWQGKAHIDSTGWTAEMRIPFSQLRFRKLEEYKWGVNFRRTLARRNEYDYLAYTPRNSSGFVSRFPTLVGVRSVSPSRALEVRPYVTSKAEYLQTAPNDPFNDGSRYSGDVGGDIKMGLGGKLTLNGAVNPDFGQVEVDPAVVNLTDYETTPPEKRPFFVEGSNNYEFGFGGANNYMGFNWGGPTFFYSRRIGRTPQGSSNVSADYADIPQAVRILGAAKVTGKIAGDWNIGLLQAVTDREMADTQIDTTRSQAEVEPLTSYTVLRAAREFNKGAQGLGAIATYAYRDFQDPALAALINKDALVAGLDGWTFLDRNQKWVWTGWGGMSRIAGTSERIADVQSRSPHYRQRPDAENYRFDPTLTSLQGYAARTAVNKQKGSVSFNSALGVIHPYFDTNDLGITGTTDEINGHVSTGYRWNNPDSWKRFANITSAVWGSEDFDGNRTSGGLWTSGGLQLLNYWYIGPRFSISPASMNNRLTRGGPVTLQPAHWDGGLFVDTDGRKKLYGYIDTYWEQSQSGSWSWGGGPGIEWKPAPNVQFNVYPYFERSHSNAEYMGTTVDAGATGTYGQRYVFAELEQKTIQASIRMNVAFTPNVSLQMYVQPFITTGQYHDFKQLIAARTYDFEPVGSGVPTYDPSTDQIDIDGGGPNDPYNPDFHITSLLGNAVLRWEYMPGSTVFLVWTQSRQGYENQGEFQGRESVSEMLRVPPNNIFLVKVTYYMNL
jgi:hypothetical protein